MVFDIDPAIATGVSLLSLISFGLGVVLTPWLVSKLAQDFFLTNQKSRHLLWVVVRNIIGWMVFGLGFVMLFTPGQGLVTILLALALVDFPYKQNILQQIAQNPRVWRTLNRWRQKHHKKPFTHPRENNQD